MRLEEAIIHTKLSWESGYIFLPPFPNADEEIIRQGVILRIADEPKQSECESCVTGYDRVIDYSYSKEDSSRTCIFSRAEGLNWKHLGAKNWECTNDVFEAIEKYDWIFPGIKED